MSLHPYRVIDLRGRAPMLSYNNIRWTEYALPPTTLEPDTVAETPTTPTLYMRMYALVPDYRGFLMVSHPLEMHRFCFELDGFDASLSVRKMPTPHELLLLLLQWWGL